MGFDPSAGKGPAARATLYFLLRYPGVIGDSERELPVTRLGILLRWHEADPVSEYESPRRTTTARLPAESREVAERRVRDALVEGAFTVQLAQLEARHGGAR
jgi:Endonuclease I